MHAPLQAGTAGLPPAGRNEAVPHRLWLAGAAVVALTLATPVVFRSLGDNAYMVMALLIGFVALAATPVAERSPKAFWFIIAIAALLRLVLLILDPLLSSDVYRYVWDGKVQAAGINPYRYIPADPVLAPLRDGVIYDNINRADYAVTIYPPVAQMFFFLATRLGETVTAVKLAMLGCEAVTVTMIVLLLRRIGRPVTRIVAYAWHPLPLWEIANNGHVDALMTALMMLGLWLAISGRPLRGGIAIALGALAKPLAVLALAPVWRAWDWKLPLVVVAAAALCYAPYLSVGTGVLGFLPEYLTEEKYDVGGFIWPLAALRVLAGGAFRGDIVLYVAGSVLLLAAMAMVSAQRERRSAETMLADTSRLMLAALFLISPNYPWYVLAATPFVALSGGAPVWAMTLGAVLLHEEVYGDLFIPPLWRKSVLYGAFLVACGYAIWRARSAPTDGDSRA